MHVISVFCFWAETDMSGAESKGETVNAFAALCAGHAWDLIILFRPSCPLWPSSGEAGRRLVALRSYVSVGFPRGPVSFEW